MEKCATAERVPRSVGATTHQGSDLQSDHVPRSARDRDHLGGRARRRPVEDPAARWSPLILDDRGLHPRGGEPGRQLRPGVPATAAVPALGPQPKPRRVSAGVSAFGYAPIASVAKRKAFMVEAPGIEPSRSEGRERRCSEKQALYRLNASFDAPPRESLSVGFRRCRGTVWGTGRRGALIRRRLPFGQLGGMRGNGISSR
jgi:hypothetical protein